MAKPTNGVFHAIEKRSNLATMGPTDWLDQIDAVISACDESAQTTYMNAKAAANFASAGGYELIGTNLSNCHPGDVQERFLHLMKSQKLQAYTIEKNGKRKLIYQVPIFRDGTFAGYVELGLPIPEHMPHFVRT